MNLRIALIFSYLGLLELEKKVTFKYMDSGQERKNGNFTSVRK